jgi:hypothetical protein
VTTPDDERETKMTVVVAAAGFDRASVFLADFDVDKDGEHWPTGFGGGPSSVVYLDVFVARRLSDPDAEATALHELAHVALGHDESPEYAAALEADRLAGIDHHRGPWEIEADSLAAALIEGLVEAGGGGLTGPDASLIFLADDVDRYSGPDGP